MLMWNRSWNKHWTAEMLDLFLSPILIVKIILLWIYIFLVKKGNSIKFIFTSWLWRLLVYWLLFISRKSCIKWIRFLNIIESRTGVKCFLIEILKAYLRIFIFRMSWKRKIISIFQDFFLGFSVKFTRHLVKDFE